jgi:cytidine deaminase
MASLPLINLYRKPKQIVIDFLMQIHKIYITGEKFMHATLQAFLDTSSVTLSTQEKDLLERALKASDNAYSHYSHYHVGVAVLTEEENIFTGCNVENDAYGSSMCGDRNAIMAAENSEGPHMRLKTIAIVVRDTSGRILAEYGSPCGACRQVMAQFGLDATVIYAYDGRYKKSTVRTLLPDPFTIQKTL